MYKIFNGIAMISILLLTLTGCETDNTALLTDGVWNFENMTTDSEDEGIKLLVVGMKAAFTDGTLEFNSDKTFILEAPLLEIPTQSGTWSLIGDDQLILDGDDQFTGPANIQTLSKKELKYIQTFTDANLTTFNLTTTWTRD